MHFRLGAYFFLLAVLSVAAMVDAAPIPGLKQFNPRRGVATAARAANRALPSRVVVNEGAQPSLWRRDARNPRPSARWYGQA
ncbi:hypothetical protein HDZ31DRAFT_61589 [Schizophyllum fasciatum]